MRQKRPQLMNLLTKKFASLARSKSARPHALIETVSTDILDLMSELFLAINDRGQVVYANATMLRLIGCECGDIFRVHYRDVLAIPSAESIADLIDRAMVAGQATFGECDLGTKNGRYGVRVHLVPGGLHLFLAPLDGAAQALGLGPARGEVGDPTLLTDLSRELHGAVQSVLGASEFLLGPGQAPADRMETVRSIRAQAGRLGRMAVDLADLALLTKQAPKLHDLTLPMVAFFDQMSTEWVYLARERNVAFALSSNTPLPSHVTTDPVRLKQILWDMLGYLVTHNESGGVDVRVSCPTDQGTQPWRLKFLLRDHVPGQPDDETWFAQKVPADGLTPLDIQSLEGLGGVWLRVARLLLTAMKGELYVLTARGVGESAVGLPKIIGFGLELCIGDQAQAGLFLEDDLSLSRTQSVATLPSRKPLEGAQILVIDDAPDAQIGLGRMLRLAGADVRVAGTGLEGLELALAGAWHLVLIDTHVTGGLDGYEVARHLRQAGFDRPVIALAAKPSSAERRRVLVSGFDAYLAKPIDRLMLIEVVADQLIRSGRALASYGSELPPSDLLH